MNINTKFVTDNRKPRLNRSKTYTELLQSGQDSSSYGESAMNLEPVKNQFLNSKSSTLISIPLPALCSNTSSAENSSANKCNELFLESTQDRELLDIIDELQNHKPCNNDIKTCGSSDERLQGHFHSDTVFNFSFE